MASNRKNNYRKKQDIGEDIFSIIMFIALFLLFNYWQYIIAIIILFVILKCIVFIHDKDFFSKFKGIKIYYEGESNEQFLARLEQEQSGGKDKEYKINCLKKGSQGEKRILYTLEHIQSMPMYIMHDVEVQYENFKAQIDFIVVTKKSIYIIEAKDLNGNIDIESDGTFTRILGKWKKGIKNPIAQNRDHEKIIKCILKKEKLYSPITSIIVLANNNTFLHFKRGASEYKNKIFRNDRLEENLLAMENKKHIIRQEEKIRRICDAILNYKIRTTEKQKVEIVKDKEVITEKLKEYRKKMSVLENIPVYMIYQDNTIIDLVEKRPATIKELYNIVGLGDLKIKKYGEKIIEIINEDNNKR